MKFKAKAIKSKGNYFQVGDEFYVTKFPCSRAMQAEGKDSLGYVWRCLVLPEHVKIMEDDLNGKDNHGSR